DSFVRLAPKGAAFTASPSQDGFAVANLGQRPRIKSIQKAPVLKARFTSGPFGAIVGVMPQSLSKVIVHIILARRIGSPGSAWMCGHGCTLTLHRSAGISVPKWCALVVLPIMFTLSQRFREPFRKRN